MATKTLKILNVVGARPNFMKIAPLFKEYRRHRNIKALLVHTDQHTGALSDSFFRSLEIPKPDYRLRAHAGRPTTLIAAVIRNLEPVILAEKPDLVVVVGDVNSTLAAAIAANKLGIPVAHVEAGLRSFDRTMPEEVNRIITDHLSDMLFVTEKSGLVNLRNERVEKGRVYFVGNVMIDNLLNTMPKIEKSDIMQRYGLESGRYSVLTFHRPANVDGKESLNTLLETIKRVINQSGLPAIFPIHPRTMHNVKKFGLWQQLESIRGLKLIGPLDYPDFMKLVKESALVVTDSGGIQEECAFLKIPTITMRTTTERPSTVDCGANYLLADLSPAQVSRAVRWAKKLHRRSVKNIPLFDGKASRRIVRDIIKAF